MRLPFVGNGRGRQVDDMRRQLAALRAQIEINEHALRSSGAEAEAPGAYRAVRRLRESMLQSELADTRAQVDALAARAASMETVRGDSPRRKLLDRERPARGAPRLPNPRAPMRLRAVILTSAPVVAVFLLAAFPAESSLGPFSTHLATQEDAAPPLALAGDEGPLGKRAEREVPPYVSIGADVTTLSFSGLVAEDPRIESDPMTDIVVAGSDQPKEATEWPEAEPGPKLSAPRAAVVTLANVRLREQPSTATRILGSISAGSRLDVIDRRTRDWTQVQTRDGAIGWIIASALRPA